MSIKQFSILDLAIDYHHVKEQVACAFGTVRLNFFTAHRLVGKGFPCRSSLQNSTKMAFVYSLACKIKVLKAAR